MSENFINNISYTVTVTNVAAAFRVQNIEKWRNGANETFNDSMKQKKIAHISLYSTPVPNGPALKNDYDPWPYMEEYKVHRFPRVYNTIHAQNTPNAPSVSRSHIYQFENGKMRLYYIIIIVRTFCVL